MRVVGCCVYVDESPAWLGATMASFAPLCDAFVYVDGAYALYPGSMTRPASPVDSAIELEEMASALDRTLIHYRPSEPFYGNEVEKRQFAFGLAKTIPGVDSESWFLVFDADELARYVAPDVREKLEKTEALVGECWLFEHLHHQDKMDAGEQDWSVTGTESGQKFRCLFRNIPDLTVGPAHYVYSGLDPDTGELGYLWGDPRIHQPYAAAEDLTAYLRVEHRRNGRIQARNQAAAEFYRKRDQLGIEKMGIERHTRGLDGEWRVAK